MFKKILVSIFAFLMTYPVIACDLSKESKKLIEIESNKLLGNAPTFKHAFEDKAIKVNLSNAIADQGYCVATLILTLPQQDLDEANLHLEANPAKKILLGAQGYAIPEKTINEVLYRYQLINGAPQPMVAENVELKSLYNNIEYTYQLLAQLRISIEELPKNTISWSYDETKREFLSCMKDKVYSEAQCNCRVKKLSDSLSPRKMELINFIQSQPYSVATGAMNSYLQFSKNINESCSK